MQQLKSGDRVRLNPSVLDDQTQKSNRRVLRRIIEEDKEGIVIEQGETLGHAGWWIKFSNAKILLEPDHVIIL